MATVSIPLTQGKVAIIDEADAALVRQYKWHPQKTRTGNEYAAGYATQGYILMHRLILDAPRGTYVDHRDGNGLNNTRGNMRFCTQAQNSANQRLNRASTSGYKGVSWNKRTRKWYAHIYHHGHMQSLGYHNNREDAARAYDVKARELFGEFANLNNP